MRSNQQIAAQHSAVGHSYVGPRRLPSSSKDRTVPASRRPELRRSHLRGEIGNKAVEIRPE